MDAQKRFLASTLQGAMDAQVVNLDDVFRHATAEVLAEHVPPEILWDCLLEGLANAGMGPGDAPPRPPELEGAEEDEDELVSLIEEEAPAEREEGARGGGSIDIDVTDALDDLPPLPEDEELAVEDVDWEGEEK